MLLNTLFKSQQAWPRKGYRQGAVAKKEIRKWQGKTSQCLPKKHFAECAQAALSDVLEQRNYEWSDMKLTKQAVDVLQVGFESTIVEILTAAEKLAAHRQWKTVQGQDLLLLRHLMFGISHQTLTLLNDPKDTKHVIKLVKARFYRAREMRAPSSRRRAILRRSFLLGVTKVPKKKNLPTDPPAGCTSRKIREAARVERTETLH